MLTRYEIKGKHYLVTGVTSGIGYSLVHDFIKQGAKITGIGRNKEVLSELENLYPTAFKGIELDLSITDSLEASLLQLDIENVNGFVHAAGLIQRRPLNTINTETFHEILNVNLVAGAMMVKFLNKQKLFLPSSAVVFISSVASTYAAIGNIMYMSSKGGVNSMVKGLALELARKGIRVNAVEPALIKTKLTEGISDLEIEAVIPNYPLGRIGNPEDVTAAIQFLLSEASSWMTGQFLRIDGGLTLK